MKKILLIILCCLCLCGCGEKIEEKEPEADKNIESKTEDGTISESELGIKYNYDQVYYRCSLYSSLDGKNISVTTQNFYFDEEGNTTETCIHATYSDGTEQNTCREPDNTISTYRDVKNLFINSSSSWKCNLFLRIY